MARIRDLGINFIPVTMRPLEIGPGAAFPGIALPGVAPPLAHFVACEETGACSACDDNTDDGSSCSPSGCCQPQLSIAECAEGSGRPGYHTSGFTDDAVAQLRGQLRAKVRNAFVN